MACTVTCYDCKEKQAKWSWPRGSQSVALCNDCFKKAQSAEKAGAGT